MDVQDPLDVAVDDPAHPVDPVTLLDCSDTLPAPLAAVSIPTDVDVRFDDLDLFDLGVHYHPHGYMSLSPDLACALSPSSGLSVLSDGHVTALLDSGCSQHIIKDRSLFSTYDISGATSVTMANCGSLRALASGDVSIRVLFKGHLVTIVFRNCLHVPDVPIHLLSVGVLQHARIAICFEPGSEEGPPHTDIVFPMSHPILPGHILRAVCFR